MASEAGGFRASLEGRPERATGAAPRSCATAKRRQSPRRRPRFGSGPSGRSDDEELRPTAVVSRPGPGPKGATDDVDVGAPRELARRADVARPQQLVGTRWAGPRGSSLGQGRPTAPRRALCLARAGRGPSEQRPTSQRPSSGVVFLQSAGLLSALVGADAARKRMWR